MSEEKDLQQRKKEAAERARQLARERLAAKRAAEQTEQPLEEPKVPTEEKLAEDDLTLAKKKAAEEAKAKAAALAKQKAKEAQQAEGENQETAEDDLALAKKKAAAAAKAKAAALAKQKAKEAAGDGAEEDLAKQKAIAAAKAKAKAAGDSEPAAKKEETPSPNQPLLDKYVKVIREHLGEDVLEDAYINRLSKDVPTLVAKKDTYYKIAEFLKYNEQLSFGYLSELHGTDFQTHMEVYVHLYSYKKQQAVALKVKIDRDQPEIDSLVPLWQGANWPECEAYDLLGIRFKGHPNLIRIFLGEDWVGYPLRKDYEPYDAEV